MKSVVKNSVASCSNKQEKEVREGEECEAKHVNILPYFVYLLMSTCSDEKEGVIQLRSNTVVEAFLH